MSIFPSMTFFLASIWVSIARTAAACWSAVSLSRRAWVTLLLSELTFTPLDWLISLIAEAWLRNCDGSPVVSAANVGSSPELM